MKTLPQPLAPGARIGILGGGQLGRMLALAAAKLSFKPHIYAPEQDSPAFSVAHAHTIGRYLDFAALAQFAAQVDVVTYEFENVPAETAAFLAARQALAPSASALATAQDRVVEKDFISALGIAVAPYAAVSTEAELVAAVERIGRPAILKTRRFGYDGKGQVKIGQDDSALKAWAEIGGMPAIVEGFVSFTHEISVIVARNWQGEVAAYDVPHNLHHNHILKTSSVPADLPLPTLMAARDMAMRIVTALDYVGIMGLELFVNGDQIIVNEMAPRVHNSGHWTQDACTVSQFEQHIRAICGWPLGDVTRHSNVVMHNLLGLEALEWQQLAAQPNSSLHLYGKAEPREGRKMGHINILTPRQR